MVRIICYVLVFVLFPFSFNKEWTNAIRHNRHFVRILTESFLTTETNKVYPTLTLTMPNTPTFGAM